MSVDLNEEEEVHGNFRVRDDEWCVWIVGFTIEVFTKITVRFIPKINFLRNLMRALAAVSVKRRPV